MSIDHKGIPYFPIYATFFEEEVIELLEAQKELLRIDELDVLEKYRMHIYGFALNHTGNGGFVVDAPRFPEEIFSILE